jgi:hypothetical protein
MDDRRIHARDYSGVEIVRYDRAGKWYAEQDGHRSHISVSKAVAVARYLLDNDRGEVFFGLPGGAMFDAKVRLASDEAER